jgi:hypothetical protein
MAGTGIDTMPNAVRRGLLATAPFRWPTPTTWDLTVHGSLIDHPTMHEALPVANHQVRGTDAIISNDEASLLKTRSGGSHRSSVAPLTPL